MGKTHRIFCLSEALSPISHQSGTSGNESVCNTEAVVTDVGVRLVPVLSANAVRHRAVRATGARFLVDRWELAGKLSLRQLSFLFHGGTLTESTGRESTESITTVNRLFPLFRLLGGSLPSQILAGSLIAWRGMLVCRENEPRLRDTSPSGWWDAVAPLRPAEEFVNRIQYTRGDARKTQPDILPIDAAVEEGDSSQMIFAGQSIVPGAIFAHGFVLQNVGDLEVGAFLLSLRLWQAGGGTIGGQSARGHGRLLTKITDDPGLVIPAEKAEIEIETGKTIPAAAAMRAGELPDEDFVVSAYIAHVDAVKDEAIAWLQRTFDFSPKPDKAKGGRKTKKGAVPDAAPEGDSLPL